MDNIKRQLKFERFLRITTFHGLIYLKTKNRKQKISWFILASIFAVLMVFTTVLMLITYFQYETYVVENEYERDKLEALPNMIVCPSDKISLIDSLVSFKPELKETVKEIQRLVDLREIKNGNMDEYLKHRLNRNSSSELFDYAMIQRLNSHFEANGVLSPLFCQIILNYNRFNCSDLIKTVFTFNGPCFVVSFQSQYGSLLRKQIYPLSNSIDYRITIILQFFSQEKQHIHFDLFSTAEENEFLFIKDLKMLENFKKYQLVASTIHEIYSREHHYKTCLPKNDEVLCHYECLQSLIKKLLNCHFTLNDADSPSNVKSCSIQDLIIIEEIIKNYEKLRNQFNLCDRCMRNCETFDYDIASFDQMRNEYANWPVLEVYLELYFKEIEKTYILRLGLTELLNFINGLWSLFFGISILLLWEIIEVAYAITQGRFKWTNKLSKWIKFKTSKINRFCNRLSKSIEVIFNETNFHGFKNIVDKYTDTDETLRWVCVIILVTLACFYVSYTQVSQYMEYKIETVSREEPLQLNSNRNITFMVCRSIEERTEYKNLFKNLRATASLLQNNSIDLDLIINEYVNHVETYNRSIDSGNSTNIIGLYNQVFSNIYIKYTFKKLNNSDLKILKETFFNFYQQCTYYEHVMSDLTGALTTNALKMKIECQPDCARGLAISALDSQCLYNNGGSSYGESSYFKDITAVLHYSSYLEEPYEASCVNLKKKKNSNYNRQVCLQDCYNEIIFEQFGCKILYEDRVRSNEKYCHPLMMPLVYMFERHLLNKRLTGSECKHCRIPCEIYYYKLYIDEYLNGGFGGADITVSNYMLVNEQRSIETLQNTIFILISYYGLFFGGSLFALLQIVYNIGLLIPFKNVKSRNIKILNSPLFNAVSNLTTIHCINYISTKKHYITRLLWISLIGLTLIASAVITIIEVKTFLNSNDSFIRKELDASKLDLPKIEICDKYFSKEDSFSFIKYYLSYVSNNKMALLLDNMFYDITFGMPSANKDWGYCPLSNNTCPMNNYLNVLNNNYKALLVRYIRWYRIPTGIIQKKFFSIMNSLPAAYSVALDDQDKFTNNEPLLPMKIYYQTKGRQNIVRYCKAINWHNYYENSSQLLEFNPFIKHKNRIRISLNDSFSKEYRRVTQIYYDDMELVSSIDVNDNIFYMNFETKFDLDSGCKGKCKWIYNQIKHDYDDYRLFNCNEELQNAFYEVFQCTPFYKANISQYEECDLGLMPLISFIFYHFPKDYNNCELFKRIPHLEYMDTSFKNKRVLNESTWIIDFNSVRIFDDTLVKDYDMLQLLVNLSNYYNVLIGFSLLSVFEIIYILTIYCCYNERVTPFE